MNIKLNFQEIGSRIQFYRAEKRMTQEELSEIVGTSQKYISRIEMGYHSTKLETIAAIASALQVSIDLLVYGYDGSDEAALQVILNEIRGMNPRQLEILRENIETIKKFG